MPTSEARTRANQLNAQRSTGPKTPEGKARSRANALKHGLTGEGIVLPEQDAAEVERLSLAFRDELQAEGEVGHALARRMAVMAVRMDQCVDRENAERSGRVRQALAEFEPPEGVDPAEAERLRLEAARLALFDPSPEACLARKYEAAAERCFFRSLKELRQLQKASTASVVAEMAAEARASMGRLGSFLPATKPAPSKPSTVETRPLPTPSKPLSAPSKATMTDWDPFSPTSFDLPIAIGRVR